MNDYAKQTQFAGCPNERNLCINKVLYKRAEFQTMKKQSQTKPIQTRSAAEIPTGELPGTLKPGTKQTQFFLILHDFSFQFCAGLPNTRLRKKSLWLPPAGIIKIADRLQIPAPSTVLRTSCAGMTILNTIGQNKGKNERNRYF